MVAVIGAGPAGLFAARELALQNVVVSLFNRDIKPGGLAEYGIYPEKYKMKSGLRAQFRQILGIEGIQYYGNVTVGDDGDIKLDEFCDMGFQAVLVTVGAQGTKWLGLPGESLDGVYHAKDLVYHYNRLPPFSERRFHIGRRVAIIGAGNVMLDIARYLSTQKQVEEIISVIRRGPAEVKFSKAELENIGTIIDLADLDEELARVTPVMRSVGQEPQEFKKFLEAGLVKALPNPSKARLKFRFLASPTRINGNDSGQMTSLEVEENTLVLEDGQVVARSLGSRHNLDVDTVIYAIGDRVDGSFGLPVKGSEFLKYPDPRFPIEGNSYEVFDSGMDCLKGGVFVAGWSRKASNGLVGVARKDGTCGSKAVLEYLHTLPPMEKLPLSRVRERLARLSKPVITQVELARLEAVETERARQLGLEDFKFKTNQEMFEAMGLLPLSVSGSVDARL
jgi:ferredoxin--NADP+ reductase